MCKETDCRPQARPSTERTCDGLCVCSSAGPTAPNVVRYEVNFFAVLVGHGAARGGARVSSQHHATLVIRVHSRTRDLEPGHRESLTPVIYMLAYGIHAVGAAP
jgi:hypothetical protein